MRRNQVQSSSWRCRCSGLRRGPWAARRSAQLRTASSSPKGPAARASRSGGYSVRGWPIKPIFKCSAVRVAVRSVSPADRPSLRPIRRTIAAPKESWETKRTFPSSSPRVTGLATSCSRAARRRAGTRSSLTRAFTPPSANSRSTPRTTSMTWSRVSRWWYGLPSSSRARESSGTAWRSPTVSSGGSRTAWKSKGLATTAGLLAARIGVGTSLERRGFGLLVASGLLSRLLLFTGVGHAPLSAALHQRVDKREDEEEYDRVDEQADDLGPGVHVEVAVGQHPAEDVEQAEVDHYDYRRPPGG